MPRDHRCNQMYIYSIICTICIYNIYDIHIYILYTYVYIYINYM